MIVTCPACSSRYRIRDEKITGRGARISCPKCEHKFVVHREDEDAGGADGRGVPVTFARGGQSMRREVRDEDDEADVPTTVMPHGSQLSQSIRAAAEAQRLAEGGDPFGFEGPAAEPSPLRAVASAQQLRAQGRVVPAASPSPAAPPVAAPGRGRLLLLGMVLLAVIVVAVLASQAGGV